MLHRLAAACLIALFFCSSPRAQTPTPTVIEQAQKLWQQGQTAKAQQVLESALQSNPGDARLRFQLALMHLEAGRLRQAEDMLISLTQDYPDLADPFNNLAVLLAGRGELEAARQALQHATSLQPDHAQAQENLGDVLSSLAAQAYTQAIRASLGQTERIELKLRRSQAVLRTSETARSQP